MSGYWKSVLAAGVALAVSSGQAATVYRADAPDEGAQTDALISLYQTLCLDAFPDDAAVETALRARDAVPLSDQQVHDILHGDQGKGWLVTAAGTRFTVTIELPPFHACGVRTMMRAGMTDPAPYRALLDRYEHDKGKFRASPPKGFDQGALHSIGSVEGRVTPEGLIEAMIQVSTTLTDPVKRETGQTATEVRLVHQLIKPAAPGSS